MSKILIVDDNRASRDLLRAILKPLLHTWSLSVEEQFYLIWPAAIVFAWRLGTSRAAAAMVIATGTISFVSAELLRSAHPGAVFYLAPFRLEPMWIWQGQWPLSGWQNITISLVLFVWATAIALKRGDSIVGVFNQKADAIFVATLRRWRARGWNSGVDV